MFSRNYNAYIDHDYTLAKNKHIFHKRYRDCTCVVCRAPTLPDAVNFGEVNFVFAVGESAGKLTGDIGEVGGDTAMTAEGESGGMFWLSSAS
jgi:hypothetical protein